jgi:lysozyme
LLSRITPASILADLPGLEQWLANLPPLDDDDDPGVPVPAVLRINTDYINVRSGPGLEFTPPVGILADNTRLDWYPQSQTRDAANRYDWVLVQSPTVGGWIAYRQGSVRFEPPEDEDTTSNVVIDVSHWQTITDWQAIYNDGIRAIIHKATQGLTHVDTQYQARRASAQGVGLLWGAYHFGTGDDPIRQAEHFLSTAAPDNNTLLVLDFEANPTTGQTDMNLDDAERFVQHIHERSGRWPTLYTGLWYLNRHLPPGQATPLANCPLWLASYTDTAPTPPSQWSQWSLWQYTNGVSGPEPRDVQGVSRVDRNRFNGSIDALRIFWRS